MQTRFAVTKLQDKVQLYSERRGAISPGSQNPKTTQKIPASTEKIYNPAMDIEYRNHHWLQVRFNYYTLGHSIIIYCGELIVLNQDAF